MVDAHKILGRSGKMNIQYCSDLHLEFDTNENFLKANPLQPHGEILLLAGDILPFVLLEKYSWFFDFLADHFELTYWLPGNHEYYHFNIDSNSLASNRRIRDNVFLVNNHVVRHDHVNFIFSTLWSEISLVNEWEIQRSIRDFELIKHDQERFTAFHFNRLHDTCKAFVLNALEHISSGNTVVVTHHVPTFMKYPAKYKSSPYSEAFAVELYDLIEKSNADYWLYGHHHQDVPEFQIGKTKLITNQLGYVDKAEHIDFRGQKTVVLEATE